MITITLLEARTRVGEDGESSHKNIMRGVGSLLP
jgi:hypothetical protein